ncbi:MAG: class I SAM-dependent methyltransferase [Bacteroidales bacterium]|nr:class I SAM-dependent methyltransferase [Bacteroidales bacterium]
MSKLANQFRKPSGFLGRIVSFLMKKGNIKIYHKLIPELEIKETDKLFEIGYGHGVGIKMIAKQNNCCISGIDFSELMYKEAAKRNRKLIKDKNVSLSYGDFLTYEMIARQYDKIFCINVIYFWDNLDVPFQKIKDGLKDNGMFCFYMAHKDELSRLKFTEKLFQKYSIEEVVEKLKLSGFKKVGYNMVEHGYIIKCEKE